MSGLVSQIIPLNFAKGIDTKTDKKQLVVGVLRQAQNIVYETLLSLRKRNGYDLVNLRDLNGAKIAGINYVSKFKNELLFFTSEQLYGFSESLEQGVAKGTIYNIQPTTTSIYNSAYENDSLDSVVLENLQCFCFENTNLSTVSYSVMDNAERTLVVGGALVDSGSKNPRVANIGNFVYIFYSKGAQLRYRRFNVVTPTVLESSVLIASDVDTSAPLIDAVTVSQKIVVSYNSSVGGAKLKVFSIDSDGTASSILGITGADGSNAIDVSYDEAFRIIITYASSTAISYVIFPYNLIAPTLTPTLIETIADVASASCVATSSGNYTIKYTISDANPSNYFIKQVTANSTGTVSAPSVFKRSIGLAAKQFLFNGQIYVVTAFQSELQTTYFMLDESGDAVLKLSPNVGGANTDGVLTKVNSIEADVFQFTSQVKSRNVSENGTFFSLHGVQTTSIDFTPQFKPQTSYMSNNLTISGGITETYDGARVVESGFNVWPEGISIQSTATTGGFLTNGNRSYVAIYKWTDNSGQDHLSAESEALEVVLTGGTSTQTVTVRVPTLRLTKKNEVVIELYGTENAGTVYYKVTSNATPVLNDPAVDFVDIVVTISDANLISRETLYTTGGVLENIAPPSAAGMATVLNRVVLIGLEEPNTAQFSKLKTDGKPVEFNDDLQIYVDPVGGALTAVAELGGKTIFFEESAIFYVAGEGPNNTGEQDNWTKPELIDSTVGCIDPTSVVLTPEGLMFKSAKGIYLLNPGLGVSYIGAPVEEYNVLSISSAKVIGEVNQVRFTTSDGACLVYNYHLGLWATYTNHEALAAEVIGDAYYYIRQDGSLYRENEVSFSDAGSPIKFKIETGWMSLNQIQGFQRVRDMLFIGDYKSPHKIRTQFAYNFVEAYTQEKTTDSQDVIDSTPYGGYSPYGLPPEIPYGGNGTAYQFSIDLKQQKCQTIRICIEDMQSVPGEGFSLSALTFEVAGKTGTFKLPRSQSFGSS